MCTINFRPVDTTEMAGAGCWRTRQKQAWPHWSVSGVTADTEWPGAWEEGIVGLAPPWHSYHSNSDFLAGQIICPTMPHCGKLGTLGGRYVLVVSASTRAVLGDQKDKAHGAGKLQKCRIGACVYRERTEPGTSRSLPGLRAPRPMPCDHQPHARGLGLPHSECNTSCEETQERLLPAFSFLEPCTAITGNLCSQHLPPRISLPGGASQTQHLFCITGHPRVDDNSNSTPRKSPSSGVQRTTHPEHTTLRAKCQRGSTILPSQVP